MRKKKTKQLPEVKLPVVEKMTPKQLAFRNKVHELLLDIRLNEQGFMQAVDRLFETLKNEER